MPMRGSFTAGDLGFGNGSTTSGDTNVGKASLPMTGPPAQAVNTATNLMSNGPIFWLIAILAVLGLLKAGFEFGFRTNFGTHAGV